MIHRHPHVFNCDDQEKKSKTWEELKAEEKKRITAGKNKSRKKNIIRNEKESTD